MPICARESSDRCKEAMEFTLWPPGLLQEHVATHESTTPIIAADVSLSTLLLRSTVSAAQANRSDQAPGDDPDHLP